MRLPFARRRAIEVALPQNLPVDLPETVSIPVPAGVAEGLSEVLAAAPAAPEVRLPSLPSVEIPSDVAERVAERVTGRTRGIRLPFGRRRGGLPSLEDLLHRRERELEQLRSQSSRNLAIGLAVGVAVGSVAVIALLPNRQQRIAELRERLGGLDAPAEYVEDARRLFVRARDSVEARVRRAKDEARLAQEETKRELWARFEQAKREGRQPPAP